MLDARVSVLYHMERESNFRIGAVIIHFRMYGLSGISSLKSCEEKVTQILVSVQNKLRKCCRLNGMEPAIIDFELIIFTKEKRQILNKNRFNNREKKTLFLVE